ncbi:MAG: outer membrane protein assembly factor BamA [Bdellovibrionales bacterium]|nr:outer membrane protein assembly factor BamA [Bdellovibrionales bacterium]
MTVRFFAFFVAALFVASPIPVAFAESDSDSSVSDSSVSDSSGPDRAITDVDMIRLEGNRAIDSEALRSQITLRPGKLSRDAISTQVKNLFETGFFDQVNAKLEVDERGRALVFLFTEKPIVRKVFIKGNEEVDEKDLAPVFKFDETRFLDAATIQLLIRQAKAFYQSKGFYRAKFEYSIAPVGNNQVDVTFTVEEGERLKIREVEFRGLDTISDGDLQGVIQTAEYKWWNSWLFGTGRLNEELLRNDRMIIRQYFLDNGFLDGTVSEPSVEIRDDGIYVAFDVREGDVYSVASIGVSGDLIDESNEATLDGIELEIGETFEANVMRSDVFRITEKFTELGYAFANVVPDTSVNPNDRTVAVTFNVDKGNEVYVDNIRIRGNTKTYDNVIRREVRIVEGEKFSSKKISRSEALLQRLGYFEEASISTDTKEGNDKEVDLTVNVREAATGTFSAGAGFSTDQGALFNARLSENNVFGTGKRITFNADLGTQRENFILSYLDRRFDDSHWIFGAEAQLTQRQFPDFDRDIDGGNVSFGYPLEEFFGEWSEDINFSLQYEYLDTYISNVDINDAAQLVIDSQGSATASAVTPSLTRNTINNPLNPTDGSRQSIALELAGLGGSEDYYLFSAQQQLYHPLYKKEEGGTFVFGWRTRFNYGDTYDGDLFPLFRRFFPGGINSVRGFEARKLGPKDANGNEFGGSKQLINNLELIFPLLTSAGLNGVVFYDIGEAFDDDQQIKFSELRQAYGFGLRWNSPLGPIRVEFGIPIDRETGEDSMVTLFSFGAPL